MTKEQHTALFIVRLQGIMSEGLMIANPPKEKTAIMMGYIQNAHQLTLRQVAEFFFDLDMEAPRFEFVTRRNAGQEGNNEGSVRPSEGGNGPEDGHGQ